MNPESTNAEAGPSTSRPSPPSTSSAPQLFLPPPAPPQTHPAYLSSTQDLLARFHLHPAYDKYVRPFTASEEASLDQLGAPAVTPGANGTVDKGKAKEVEGLPATPGGIDGGDGDDDDGKGDKKKNKNSYKHLIGRIPGKHSMKKDDYLFTMMQVPPKQRIAITPFDLRTQRDAFTVSLEGLKSWNRSALEVETAQAREDRKKRKEAKRLQKLQAQALSQPAAAALVAHPQPVQAPIPMSGTPSFNRPPQNLVSNGTPRPGSTASVSRPTHTTAGPPAQRPGSAVAKSTVPRPGSTVPRPGSTVPRPGLTKPIPPPVQAAQIPVGRVTTPMRSVTTATPSANLYQMSVDPNNRGKKRERDDVITAVNGTATTNINTGAAVINAPRTVLNAKAGKDGIRPRPIKKQRMNMQGQAMDVTVAQQPTPQGV